MLIILLLCIAPCLTMMGQTKVADDVVEMLAEMGFENVGCAEDDKERIYVLQNTAYRANGVGIATAVDVIQKNGFD